LRLVLCEYQNWALHRCIRLYRKYFSKLKRSSLLSRRRKRFSTLTTDCRQVARQATKSKQDHPFHQVDVCKLSVCFFICLPVCPHVCLFVRMSACLSACPHVCLPVYMFVCLCACLSACLCVCMAVCELVCLSACLSACLLACLPISELFRLSQRFFCLSASCLTVRLSYCPFV